MNCCLTDLDFDGYLPFYSSWRCWACERHLSTFCIPFSLSSNFEEVDQRHAKCVSHIKTAIMMKSRLHDDAVVENSIVVIDGLKLLVGTANHNIAQNRSFK